MIACEQRNQSERESHSDKRRKIERADVKKHRPQRLATHETKQQTDYRPDEHQFGGPADNQPQDVATLRTECHPHPNLMRPLHDQERHHAIDADRCEDQRDRCKHRE